MTVMDAVVFYYHSIDMVDNKYKIVKKFDSIVYFVYNNTVIICNRQIQNTIPGRQHHERITDRKA